MLLITVTARSFHTVCRSSATTAVPQAGRALSCCKCMSHNDKVPRQLPRQSHAPRLRPRQYRRLGRYAFILPDAVARGELRPLRKPAAHGTDADEPGLT